MLNGHEAAVLAVAVAPDGRTAASAGMDGRIRLWNLAERSVIRTLVGHRGPVWSLAFSPDGRVLLSAGSDGVVKVWDVASGTGSEEHTSELQSLMRTSYAGFCLTK